MFNCVLTDPKILRSVVEAIAVLIDEGTFIADSSGLTLSEMDPGKVGMVQIKIPSEAFEEYSCKEQTFFRLDITELKKIVSRAGPGDRIVLSLKPEENKFIIQLLGKGTRTFVLGPRDVGEIRTKTPQIPFKVDIRLVSDALTQAVKDVALFAENITFVADKQQFKIRGEGNIGEVEVLLKPDDEESVLSYGVQEESRASYALNYLGNMVKASTSARTVIIRYATNMPMEIEFELLDAGEGAYIKYLLAPRRES
ncbi:MAG: proliferating cell nuclear antigen (pcna) [Candidatus Ranarchaeia archaeon]